MEEQILTALDEAIRAPRAAAFLAALTGEVASVLKSDAGARLAWRSVPLDVYEALPEGIASSWVFVLRAGCSSGAERHPNSVQRVMSYGGSADMQMWDGAKWVSNVLVSEAGGGLEKRWLTIPTNTWHRPMMGNEDWVVVSFHTASDQELIEELPVDDEQPDRGSRESKVYAGREAR